MATNDGTGSGTSGNQHDETLHESKLMQQISRMIAEKGGDQTAVIRALFEDNYQIRLKYQAARRLVEDLRGKMPADGALGGGPRDCRRPRVQPVVGRRAGGL